MRKKKKKADDETRVLIAVTESSPVTALWRAAMDHLRESPSELVALYIHDERWHRAASLPFTREISRISGAMAEFTAQRAEQLNREMIARIQQRFNKLASESNLPLAFEVLPESDRRRIEELIGSGRNLLIAPSLIATRPIYAHLARLKCRIQLVDATNEDEEED